ncbi:MAG TPA: molybdopterin-dependent oxidoreductase [Phycisphaerae bacterium]|nr:molybdopterin-dependent oxidoreductase [Phycisphaerae bacterium]
MNHWLTITVLALCACLLAVSGCGKERRASTQDQSATLMTTEVPHVEATLELTGSGLTEPKEFTFAQLADLDMVRLDNVMMLISHGPDKVTAWRGPSLDALLTQAKVQPGPMLLMFEAADGYGFEVSREDLGQAIVALQDGDGHWLADLDKTGPLRLVAPDKPANYWVMNLQRIKVEPIE